jgi:hypothetical protein
METENHKIKKSKIKIQIAWRNVQSAERNNNKSARRTQQQIANNEQ